MKPCWARPARAAIAIRPFGEGSPLRGFLLPQPRDRKSRPRTEPRWRRTQGPTSPLDGRPPGSPTLSRAQGQGPVFPAAPGGEVWPPTSRARRPEPDWLAHVVDSRSTDPPSDRRKHRGAIGPPAFPNRFYPTLTPPWGLARSGRHVSVG